MTCVDSGNTARSHGLRNDVIGIGFHVAPKSTERCSGASGDPDAFASPPNQTVSGWSGSISSGIPYVPQSWVRTSVQLTPALVLRNRRLATPLTAQAASHPLESLGDTRNALLRV